MNGRSLLRLALFALAAARLLAGGIPAQDELHSYTAFVPGTDLVLLAAADRSLLVYDRSAASVRAWIPQDGLITALRSSPDGRHIAAGVHFGFHPVSGYLAAWSLDQGRYIGAISTPASHALDFAGDALAVAMFGDLYLWRYLLQPGEGRTFRRVDALVSGEPAINALKAYGGRLLLAFSDGSCRLISPAGLGAASLSAGDKSLADAALSPDGSLIATGGIDGRLVVWRLGDGASKVWEARFEGAVTAVAFDPGGRLVACATDRDELALLRVERGEPVWSRRSQQPKKARPEVTGYASLDFSPDEASLFAATVDNQFEVHPLDGGPPVPLRTRDFATAVAFSADGSASVIGTHAGRLLSRVGSSAPLELARINSPILSLSITGEGRLLVGGLDGRALEYQPADSSFKLLGEIDTLRQLRAAGDMLLLAGGRSLEAPNGMLSAIRGPERWQASGTYGALTSVLRISDVLVSGGLDGRLRVWKPFSSPGPSAVEELGTAVNVLLPSSDAGFIALDDEGRLTAYSWTGARLRREAAGGIPGACLKQGAVDRDRGLIAAADFTGRLWLFDLTTLRLRGRRDYQAQVTALGFSSAAGLLVFTADGEEHVVDLD